MVPAALNHYAHHAVFLPLHCFEILRDLMQYTLELTLLVLVAQLASKLNYYSHSLGWFSLVVLEHKPWTGTWMY